MDIRLIAEIVGGKAKKIVCEWKCQNCRKGSDLEDFSVDRSESVFQNCLGTD